MLKGMVVANEVSYREYFLVTYCSNVSSRVILSLCSWFSHPLLMLRSCPPWNLLQTQVNVSKATCFADPSGSQSSGTLVVMSCRAAAFARVLGVGFCRASVHSLLIVATTRPFIHFLKLEPSLFNVHATFMFADDGFVLSSADSAASSVIQVIPGPLLLLPGVCCSDCCTCCCNCSSVADSTLAVDGSAILNVDTWYLYTFHCRVSLN
jgi:hypothetical protein